MCYQHRSPSLPAIQKQQINDIFSVDVVFFKSLSWKQSSRRCRAACSPPECAILLPRLGLQSALGEIPVESFPRSLSFQRRHSANSKQHVCWIRMPAFSLIKSCFAFTPGIVVPRYTPV